VEIDLAAHLVRRGEESLRQTPIEVGVLRELLAHGGKVLSHRQIPTAVWGPYFAHERGYVRTIIRRLRQKIEADASCPSHIVTVPGAGYMWR
jgi:two-component system, OmpR family, KDP operon response regulator KdpE